MEHAETRGCPCSGEGLSEHGRRARQRVAIALGAVMVCGCGPDDGSPRPVAESRTELSGNIDPAAIQIDGEASGADLYADVGAPMNVGAAVDWVDDASAENSGSGCLSADATASCIEPGVTGAEGGRGTWQGVRVVDGIAGADQDIFLQGGKEDDFESWLVGPGSVGSSKFDITQAYLANNQDTLFFGMERRGNNGTTFFEFEFNQLPPDAVGCPEANLPDGAHSGLIPCRTEGDVLFGFEMSGSGSSGTATPYIFTWNAATHAYELDPSVSGMAVSSINASANTAGAPWGHVNRQGDWVLGAMDRFQFAEAAAPLAILPGVDSCGGEAFVQVRTRSSNVPTSDLKDTTRIFNFEFLMVKAAASVSPRCDQGIDFDVAVTDGNDELVASPTCHWELLDGNDVVVAESSDCTSAGAGFPMPAGVFRARVTASSADSPECEVSAEAGTVAVYPVLSATAALDATCASSFTYDVASASGGSGVYAYAWSFSGGATTPDASDTASGTVVVGQPGQEYLGSLTITDQRADLAGCTANASDTAVPYAPVTVEIVPSAGDAMCPMSSDALTYAAHAAGGQGPYSYQWSGCVGAGDTCVVDPDDSELCVDRNVFVVVDDASAECDAATSETETYSKRTVIASTDH